MCYIYNVIYMLVNQRSKNFNNNTISCTLMAESSGIKNAVHAHIFAYSGREMTRRPGYFTIMN